MKKYDMHCHTTYSDGTLTPEEICLLAKKQGLSGLAITDHDTIEGYLAGRAHAEKLGLKLLPGIEISSVFNEASIHVLAYSFSISHKIFQDFLRHNIASRETRNKAILENLKKLLAVPDLASKKWVYEQYDSQVMNDTLETKSDAALVRVRDSQKALAMIFLNSIQW